MLIPERNSIPDKHKWDLSPLFKSDDEWDALFKELEGSIKGYSAFRKRLRESAAVLKEAIEFDLETARKLDRLYTYAHLKSDEDRTNQKYLGLHQRAITLHSKIAELSSYIVPEIQSIPDDVMKKFMDDRSLFEYRFFLEKIFRFKPHTLKEEIEEVLAITGEIAHAPSQFFTQLDNADLKFGMIGDESGNEVELSHGNFITFLMSGDREIRKKAFHQYYKTYDDHRFSISSALAYSSKKDHIYSKVRKFGGSREAAMFSDNIQAAVYDNLIASVKQNLSPLFDYLKFRRKFLKLDELHFYDTYAPLVSDVKFNMPYEEAVDTCAEALKPLGPEYIDVLKSGLAGGWVDRYENRGKRSGAYSSGCYDSPPYILINYRDDNINSLYTLIHEAGHSMHSWYSHKNQPYLYHDYTIFVAEVASTFNEALLSAHLINKYRDDKKMKAYIINREIDNIRGTLFRQTMFAEFEKLTHETLEADMPLTLDAMTGVYGDLLKIYFGDTMTIDDSLKLECLRIPHFYSAFYVYKYATGISAAFALADMVLIGGGAARDRYLKFLGMGGSKYPIDELLEAGVDMKSPEPVERAIKHFGKLVEDLKNIL
jgi:oligoendopeptidase F